MKQWRWCEDCQNTVEVIGHDHFEEPKGLLLGVATPHQDDDAALALRAAYDEACHQTRLMILDLATALRDKCFVILHGTATLPLAQQVMGRVLSGESHHPPAAWSRYTLAELLQRTPFEPR